MTADDGAVLGRLLGLLSKSADLGTDHGTVITDVLKLHEGLRKLRATINAKGAISKSILVSPSRWTGTGRARFKSTNR